MKKELQAVYGSADKPLVISGIEIPCYVLEDKRRVIVQSGLFKALGITKGGTISDKYKQYGGGARIMRFIDQYNIKPTLDNDFGAVLKNPIVFSVNKTVHHGYEATLLQEIIRAISKEYLKGNLSQKHKAIGENAEILDDAFAKVGIIALIDEATGYQEVRDKDALKQFLEKFLLNEKGKWIPTFSDDFFESIFKMKGWTWKQASTKKPQVVGHYINNYVYSRLAPQILKELKKLNPKDEKGNRKGKHTQWIDVDFGHPKLKEHLSILTAFAKAAGYNWKNWDRMVERALPKYASDGSTSPELPFNETE